MRRVILESPFAGEIEENLRYARLCLRDSLERGEAPIASHLLYTQPGVLDDSKPDERDWGIRAGLAWREVAEAAVFYVDRGMSLGMTYARAKHLEHGLIVEERRLQGYAAPVETPEEAVFTLRAWGDGKPHVRDLADELERIAPMIRTGYQAGDAMLDDRLGVRGWWDHKGFDDE